ncbi:long-chain-fatty-acid--CoA ligase [Phosphitispora fastidiosa]|uniref:long-chain-fatty-acid--CoA ligase n=1 Tax=Phosphitispora fastidiosa TaxID=2837202 RepID=UPI001E576714|nr:long-chain fatty acid--CoA ligase [Phosphitispora fastidiosa]MBU7006246.1 long-chain acyl-CoA synthetase [Phosphitispora fastidiosa]
MTLGDILVKGCRDYPENVAFKFKDREWTYKDFEIQTNRAANGLKKLGIGRGDKVGLLMLNSPYFMICYFGIVKLGATVVPLNVMFKGGEVVYQMNDSNAAALITAPMFMPLVSQIRDRMETVNNVIVQDIDQENSYAGTVSLKAILEEEEDSLSLDYTVTVDDIAVFLYTSGTTGNPKGAMLTHDCLVANADQTRIATDSTEDDITLCVLPMFHSFAWTTCVTLPLMCGGKIIIHEGFVPQAFLRTIVEENITIIAAVPTMYSVLLQVPEVNPEDYKKIRVAYSGGAALPVEVLKKIETKYSIRVLEGYGLSECSPVCTVNPWRGVRKPGSIGIVLPGVECRIIDETGRDVPRNTPGELLFKGRNVMRGYYNLPEATAEALRDGWMYTGDIGYMDDEGYIFIVDRKKDLIIVGGLNVYPREVEEVLYSHPKIAEAAVIGVNDELRGEMVKAFITLREGETASEREIKKFCQDRLANYKLPKDVEFVAGLPKTSTGKILKRALKS